MTAAAAAVLVRGAALLPHPDRTPHPWVGHICGLLCAAEVRVRARHDVCARQRSAACKPIPPAVGGGGGVAVGSVRATAGLIGLGAGTPVVLRRMRADFDRDGAFRTSTAVAMWGLYAGTTAVYTDSVRHGQPARSSVRAVGLAAAAAGAGLMLAGMSAFSGGAQLTGTRQGPLATGGVYRLSRHPQYAGAVVAGLGVATARRSPMAGALAVAYGAVCAWWVPVEERALEREFGDDFRSYRASAPRWLGAPHLRYPRS